MLCAPLPWLAFFVTAHSTPSPPPTRHSHFKGWRAELGGGAAPTARGFVRRGSVLSQYSVLCPGWAGGGLAVPPAAEDSAATFEGWWATAGAQARSSPPLGTTSTPRSGKTPRGRTSRPCQGALCPGRTHGQLVSAAQECRGHRRFPCDADCAARVLRPAVRGVWARRSSWGGGAHVGAAPCQGLLRWFLFIFTRDPVSSAFAVCSTRMWP